MNDKLRKFIETNIHLIRENKLEEFFKTAAYEEVSENDLIDILVNAKISDKKSLEDVCSSLSEVSSVIKNYAEDLLPHVTSFSGDDNRFILKFDDDMSWNCYILKGKLVNGRYEIEFIKENNDPRYTYWTNGVPTRHSETISLSIKQIPTLFSRMSKEYNKSGSRSPYMSTSAILKGWI